MTGATRTRDEIQRRSIHVLLAGSNSTGARGAVAVGQSVPIRLRDLMDTGERLRPGRAEVTGPGVRVGPSTRSG